MEKKKNSDPLTGIKTYLNIFNFFLKIIITSERLEVFKGEKYLEVLCIEDRMKKDSQGDSTVKEMCSFKVEISEGWMKRLGKYFWSEKNF